MSNETRIITQDLITESLLDKQNLTQIIDEIIRYNRMIVRDAVSTLNDPKLAQIAWEMFIDGVNSVPFTFPVSHDKNLSNYPDVISIVNSQSYENFYTWFNEAVIDDKRLEGICEQAVMRNTIHFFDYAVRLADKIPDDSMDTMRSEMKEKDYTKRSFWLSRFMNGLQTSIAEVYVVEQYFSHSLDSG